MSTGAVGSFLEGVTSGVRARSIMDRRDKASDVPDIPTPAAIKDAEKGASGPVSAAAPPLAGGSATGASGHGKIDITYKGALDGATGDAPSPSAMYSFLIDNGASRNEALMLTGAAASESGFNYKVTHDNDTGYGLFGHRLDRLAAMRKFAGSDTPDWKQQASFALGELRSRPESKLVAEAKSPEELTVAQMHFEQPQGYTRADPRAGHNFTGRFNTLSRFNSSFGQPAAPTNTQVAPATKPEPRSIVPQDAGGDKQADALGIMGKLFPESRGLGMDIG